MNQPQAIAPPAEPVAHEKTRYLIDTLVVAGWTVGTLADWNDCGTVATLNHPKAANPIRVVMTHDDTSRLAAVFIGDRQVPFTQAIEYAAGVL